MQIVSVRNHTSQSNEVVNLGARRGARVGHCWRAVSWKPCRLGRWPNMWFSAGVSSLFWSSDGTRKACCLRMKELTIRRGEDINWHRSPFSATGRKGTSLGYRSRAQAQAATHQFLSHWPKRQGEWVPRCGEGGEAGKVTGTQGSTQPRDPSPVLFPDFQTLWLFGESPLTCVAPHQASLSENIFHKFWSFQGKLLQAALIARQLELGNFARMCHHC